MSWKRPKRLWSFRKRPPQRPRSAGACAFRSWAPPRWLRLGPWNSTIQTKLLFGLVDIGLSGRPCWDLGYQIFGLSDIVLAVVWVVRYWKSPRYLLVLHIFASNHSLQGTFLWQALDSASVRDSAPQPSVSMFSTAGDPSVAIENCWEISWWSAGDQLACNLALGEFMITPVGT